MSEECKATTTPDDNRDSPPPRYRVCSKCRRAADYPFMSPLYRSWGPCDRCLTVDLCHTYSTHTKDKSK